MSLKFQNSNFKLLCKIALWSDQRGHALSTYAKFYEKLTFLATWYAHALVRIRGLEMLVFPKILRMYLMDDSKSDEKALIIWSRRAR